MFRFFLPSSESKGAKFDIRPNPVEPLARGMAAAKTSALVLMVFDLINGLLDTKFYQDDKFHPATSYYLTSFSIPPILAERHVGEPTRKKKFASKRK